jgi:hypothetical protein
MISTVTSYVTALPLRELQRTFDYAEVRLTDVEEREPFGKFKLLQHCRIHMRCADVNVFMSEWPISVS